MNAVIPFPKHLKAILIDLDGTLLDSMEVLQTTFFQFLNSYRIKAKEIEFNNFIGKRIDQIVNELKVSHGLSETSEKLLSDYHSLLEDNYINCSPSPGAHLLLEFARSRNIQLALVTSATANLVTPILQKQGWLTLFDSICTGDRVEQTKPSGDLYQLALKDLSAEKGESIAVEDASAGIKSAKNAHIFVIGLNYSLSEEELREAGADAIVNDLNELRFFLAHELSPIQNIPPDKELKVILSKQTNHFEENLSAEDIAQIDVMWKDATTNNRELFDGNILSCSIDHFVLECKQIPYRIFFACNYLSNLKKQLSLQALAVSGICRSKNKFLLGRRASGFSRYDGLIELVPSGGVDADRLKSDGTVDYEGQLLVELEEEAGLKATAILSKRLLGFIRNETESIVDICLELELDPTVLDLEWTTTKTKEYEEFFWLDSNDAQELLKTPEKLVPASFTLLQNYFERR